MKYKWRKKYTSEDAKIQIECTLMNMQNYQEEILYAKAGKYSPLILAITNNTIESVIENANSKIEYGISKVEYLKQFLYVS